MRFSLDKGEWGRGAECMGGGIYSCDRCSQFLGCVSPHLFIYLLLYLALEKNRGKLWTWPLIIHWAAERNKVVLRSAVITGQSKTGRGGSGFEENEEGGWFTSWGGCCRAPYSKQENMLETSRMIAWSRARSCVSLMSVFWQKWIEESFRCRNPPPNFSCDLSLCFYLSVLCFMFLSATGIEGM